MAKGASIKFASYEESIPKLLSILNLQKELKKYDKVVLKPTLKESAENSTSREFLEPILKFCVEHKNPVAEVFIAEGADGYETTDLFEAMGYRQLAERYGVSLIDLNNAETEIIESNDFIKFSEIEFPKVLLNSFVISIPKFTEDDETGVSCALSSMLGAFPSSKYSGFFSASKSKIRKWPIEYSVYDINKCKTPDFAIADTSEHGALIAGLPLEIDKQAVKLIDKAWETIPHIELIDRYFLEESQEINKE